MGAPIYLDCNATTPVAPEVLEAMLPFLREEFGNPSSSHALGQRPRQAVETARDHVARLIGCEPEDVLFTGSATEANNLAILGVAAAAREGGLRHLAVSSVEHPAVMQAARELERRGWSLSIVRVDDTGRVSPSDVEAALRPDTALVSVMHANNEVGTLQPIAEISARVRGRGIVFHCDASQAAGKIPIDVDTMGVDALTLAGHKFYAPKGVGALYLRPGIRVHPLLFGGGQERGLRSATENVPAIVGLGEAARLARERLPWATTQLCTLRDALHSRLSASIPGLVLNGHPHERLPNTLHVSFPGVNGRALLDAVADTLAASLGSACHSESEAVSGVLAAMGMDSRRAMGAVRFSVGITTTAGEIERAAHVVIGAWRGLRLSGRVGIDSAGGVGALA